MIWIESGGGPLICLDRRSISSWGGIEFLSTSWRGDKEFHNDYERACSIDDYLAQIAVVGGSGIVLGDEPMMTTVLEGPRSGIQIVRWMFGNTIEDVEAIIFSPRDHSRLELFSSLSLNNGEAEWFIFDSAVPGSRAREVSLAFTMPMGIVSIDTFGYRPNENTCLILHDIAA